MSEAMTDLANRAEKCIDLEDIRPVALAGGTAILARTYRTTSFGTEIDTGEVPVATSGVWSPTDLWHALAELGVDHDHIERALGGELSGPNATRAVAIAERHAGNAEVLA